MDNNEINNAMGIIQYVGDIEDLDKEYSTIKNSFLYYYENLDGSIRFGILTAFIEKEQEKWCMNIPLSFRSFLNIKFYSDYHSIRVTTTHTIMNVFSDRYDVKFICGIIKDIHDDYFESFLVFRSGEKYTVVDLPIADIMSMTNTLCFPVFVNNEIIKRRKMNYETAMKFLN
jgi:bifunctional DNase/RNase